MPDGRRERKDRQTDGRMDGWMDGQLQSLKLLVCSRRWWRALKMRGWKFTRPNKEISRDFVASKLIAVKQGSNVCMLCWPYTAKCTYAPSPSVALLPYMDMYKVLCIVCITGTGSHASINMPISALNVRESPEFLRHTGHWSRGLEEHDSDVRF